MADAEVKSESEPISIFVKDQSGDQVQFKVKSHTKFEKIFSAFATKKSLDPSTLKFVFEGERVLGTHTPGDLQMEDNDTVDVFIQQLGGASPA
mmetsp:Transcript_4325/g.9375  ORF Transcript_4325/g.9375 Transcript_4325/m.9375 type:complete len:93 (+) Transcript_4325:196-474(+)|eukprot:CAMPEP_0202890170 /NCGR_PEP_ID=MMETSP1392-20130828/671_1 /ASSEMBLY_ACC=CAM_ASM_000868 /TAXON_ID=225041 /ORGANISM="Chlamydomonas chlamydogama, Strain SAG 11-48b" /LENGTH=92 /DNA_ID=CAMNT_0049573699 /DNA_START=177 /DNA_END=455 /DNA_ORIENTATION=-